MSRRWMILGGVAAVILVTLVVLSNMQLVPACTDPRVSALAVQILGKHLNVPGRLSLHNIRVLSGGLFAHRWECEAEVRGIKGPRSAASVNFGQVIYASQITADTHRLYVTARMVPSR